MEGQCELVFANTFIWARQSHRFGGICPGWSSARRRYDFYVERRDEMLALIGKLMETAPPESLAVVEADAAFRFRAAAPRRRLGRSLLPPGGDRDLPQAWGMTSAENE